MRNFTPLRYPGGKGKLAPFVKELFRFNNLSDGAYVEPYAGGAGVAFSLLLEGCAGDIFINDIDRAVYAFWWTVLNDSGALVDRICGTPVTMDTWREQKGVFERADSEDVALSDLGFATFFLNRTNRSGILKAGVIGGKNQDGPFKIDARFNRQDLVERIRLIAKYSGRVHLYNKDAKDFIVEVSRGLPKKSLLYCDPPYFHKGKLLYKNCYTMKDHREIASIVRSLGCPWIVTYDNVPEICALYEGCGCEEFDIAYSAHVNRVRGDEVMFYGNVYLPRQPYARKAS